MVYVLGYDPESLGEWKHGCSQGIVVSEKNQIVVYWSMVW